MHFINTSRDLLFAALVGRIRRHLFQSRAAAGPSVRAKPRPDWSGFFFGSPTYLGNVSAAFKAFQDMTSSAVVSNGYAWLDKVAAGYTSSGALCLPAAGQASLPV
ncbi:NAD(P)H-dependent oxidoreductase [Pseudomonas piscis]|uniref:NAD(P)H-dependent oxidoreductase n=1 Tax=Pseudomonas piscis TaxID=2614538 RepID=UPI0021D5E725|nr:NAD(P)H-dependent oxidoreductase [Pseudomonas piscis]MCU7645835.1 NAD(P)H-dependent oxidoreductase [Pseudomonas piscis]